MGWKVKKPDKFDGINRFTKNMQIIFKNFKVSTVIGVYEEERLKKTELSISIKIGFDAKNATQTDNLNDTIDYDKIAAILNQTADSSFKLIETLSQDIINNLVKQFPIIQNIEVEIIKPNIVPQAEAVSVKEFYNVVV